MEYKNPEEAPQLTIRERAGLKPRGRAPSPDSVQMFDWDNMEQTKKLNNYLNKNNPMERPTGWRGNEWDLKKAMVDYKSKYGNKSRKVIDAWRNLKTNAPAWMTGKKLTVKGKKRWVIDSTDLDRTKQSFGKWRAAPSPDATWPRKPAEDETVKDVLTGDAWKGGRRKKRKTRKRRRKKRTKKKTRRKRRKSRKRKTKRRRKKKTRKRKAGCWPFCRPRVLEEEPLVQRQQQEAPQQAPNENPREKAARLQHEFEGLESSRTRHYQDEMDRRLDARKAKQREVGGTQGGDD